MSIVDYNKNITIIYFLEGFLDFFTLYSNHPSLLMYIKMVLKFIVVNSFDLTQQMNIKSNYFGVFSQFHKSLVWRRCFSDKLREMSGKYCTSLNNCDDHQNNVVLLTFYLCISLVFFGGRGGST